MAHTFYVVRLCSYGFTLFQISKYGRRNSNIYAVLFYINLGDPVWWLGNAKILKCMYHSWSRLHNNNICEYKQRQIDTNISKFVYCAKVAEHLYTMNEF
jgi:hypothetical protein